MKLFISADIEGTAGIVNWKETEPGDQYAYFAGQMTREVAAACEGALAGGVTEILVRDAHDSARNLNPAAMPRPARLLRGWTGGPASMMDGLEPAFGAAAMTGYHTCAGSDGNPLAHTILRGYVNKHGNSLPNYHYEDLQLLCQMYAERDLKYPACIVDCNHANSGKQYREQIRIAKEVLHSRRHSEDIRGLVKGLMIESYLEAGNQKTDGHIYGKSITDPCLGWEDSERLLYEIADSL